MLTDVCGPDLVVGLGADVWSEPAAGLHPGPLRLQPLLLPGLRHPGRQEHLHGHGQGESPPPPPAITMATPPSSDPCRLTASALCLQVPDGVTVLMSASRSSYSKQDRVFQFSMEFPVPSYLVALIAGDLQHVDVGPRSVPAAGPVWVQFRF